MAGGFHQEPSTSLSSSKRPPPMRHDYRTHVAGTEHTSGRRSRRRADTVPTVRTGPERGGDDQADTSGSVTENTGFSPSQPPAASQLARGARDCHGAGVQRKHSSCSGSGGGGESTPPVPGRSKRKSWPRQRRRSHDQSAGGTPAIYRVCRTVHPQGENNPRTSPPIACAVDTMPNVTRKRR